MEISQDTKEGRPALYVKIRPLMDGNLYKSKGYTIYYMVKIRPLMDGNFESEYNKVIKDIVKIRPLMDGNEPICDGSIRNYEC